MKVKSESEVAQSCLTLCDPMDCSLPGSSIHGILWARILEWVAIPFSTLQRGDPECHNHGTWDRQGHIVSSREHDATIYLDQATDSPT